jgi:putative ABC transport system permease protein
VFFDCVVMHILQLEHETASLISYALDDTTVTGLSSPVPITPMRADSASSGYLLAEGRWFSGPGEAVGGATFAKEAHLKVGDSFTASINNHPMQLRLVGVYYDADNFGRIIRIDWSDYLTANPNAQPQYYNITLRAGADPQAYTRRVSASAPDFLSVQPRSAGTPSFIAIANTVILVLAVVLAIIAIAGVFNTVLLNTRERMQDIATVKALGMSPGQVVSMVASSACVLGLLGSVLGIPAGIWLHRTLLDLATSTLGDQFPASFYQGAFSNVAILLLIALAGVVAALLGAALPARSAARHSVVEVLRAE